MTERIAPTLITDDTHLGGADTCALCNLRTRAADGTIVSFAYPSRLVCGLCVAAILDLVRVSLSIK
jgi:hypothetical protein